MPFSIWLFAKCPDANTNIGSFCPPVVRLLLSWPRCKLAVGLGTGSEIICAYAFIKYGFCCMGSKIVGAIPTVVANKIITRDRMIDILYFDMEKNMLTRECIELIHKFFS